MSSWLHQPPVFLRYGVAVASVAAALSVEWVAVAIIEGGSPIVSLLFCAIMLTVWFGGLGPGLFATVISALAFDYYFIAPAHSWAVAFTELPRFFFFIVSALFMVLLGASQRRTAGSLQLTRNSLEQAVSDLDELNKELKAENGERLRAEQSIRAAERELQMTVDTIPVMVASYDSNGMLSFVNKNWRDYTGLALADLKPGQRGLAVHPDDKVLIENAWRHHLDKGEAFQIEQRMRRADGEYRWYIISRVPLRDENGKVIKWYGAGYDIEDQKRSLAALQRSEAYLEEGERLSKTGSFSWNLATNENYWSKEIYNILGVPTTIKPGLDVVRSRVHPEDRALLESEMYRVKKGGLSDFEHRLLMPDGEVKILHLRSHRIKYASGEEEVVGAVVDITAARQAQEALQAAQAELAHATRVASLGEMSASIAHEVNQPLAAINAYSEAGLRWLRRAPPALDEAIEIMRRTLDEANRASRIIRGICDFAKKAELEMVSLNVNDVIEKAIALVRREALLRQASVELNLAPDMPLVRGDQVQLQQVVVNLLINGLQAMETVNDRPRVLIVTTKPCAEDRAQVTIQDAGVGIEADDPKRLFNAFYTTKPAGLGMGLSICRSIIESHGGRIWAARNEGPGAAFHFTLSA